MWWFWLTMMMDESPKEEKIELDKGREINEEGFTPDPHRCDLTSVSEESTMPDGPVNFVNWDTYRMWQTERKTHEVPLW